MMPFIRLPQAIVIALTSGAFACSALTALNEGGGPGGTGGTGGTAETGGADTGGAGGSSGGSTVAVADCDGLDGSYKLALAYNNTSDFEAYATRFTLTLASTPKGCRATLTPKFYPSTEALAVVTDGELTIGELPADGRVFSTSLLATAYYWGLTFFYEYYWHQLVIPRMGAGLGENATAQVSVASAEDDVCDVFPSDYAGTVAVDDESPTITAGPASIVLPTRPPTRTSCFVSSGGKQRPGLPDALLPWDVIEVRASEPLAGLATKVSLMPVNDAAVGVVWTAAETEAQVITKDTWLWGRFQNWDAVRGTTQTVQVAAGLVDATGHELPAQAFALDVLDVGEALEEHLFGGAMTVKALGAVSQGDGYLTATAPCNSGVGGIAGRLLTLGHSRVAFRVDPTDTVVIRVVGRSGRNYVATSDKVEDAEGYVLFEATIEDESEVGFTVVPNSMCHWTTETHVKLARIWTE